VIDILTASIASIALVVVYAIDPHHSARHNISDIKCQYTSGMLLLFLDGMNMILFAAIMYSIKNQVVAGAKWVWGRARRV
jgi:hypothetical protein